MVVVPEGDWSCPRCSAEVFPEKIEKILAWKWKEAPCVEVVDDRPGKEGQMRKIWGMKTRIYLVKYKNFSYWRCEWISELRLEVHEVHLWRYYNNRQNMDDPTWTEDVDRFEDPELAERLCGGFDKFPVNFKKFQGFDSFTGRVHNPKKVVHLSVNVISVHSSQQAP